MVGRVRSVALITEQQGDGVSKMMIVTPQTVPRSRKLLHNGTVGRLCSYTGAIHNIDTSIVDSDEADSIVGTISLAVVGPTQRAGHMLSCLYTRRWHISRE